MRAPGEEGREHAALGSVQLQARHVESCCRRVKPRMAVTVTYRQHLDTAPAPTLPRARCQQCLRNVLVPVTEAILADVEFTEY